MRNGEIHADNDKNDNIDTHSQINMVYVISDLNRKLNTMSRSGEMNENKQECIA